MLFGFIQIKDLLNLVQDELTLKSIHIKLEVRKSSLRTLLLAVSIAALEWRINTRPLTHGDVWGRNALYFPRNR